MANLWKIMWNNVWNCRGNVVEKLVEKPCFVDFAFFGCEKVLGFVKKLGTFVNKKGVLGGKWNQGEIVEISMVSTFST